MELALVVLVSGLICLVAGYWKGRLDERTSREIAVRTAALRSGFDRSTFQDISGASGTSWEDA